MQRRAHEEHVDDQVRHHQEMQLAERDQQYRESQDESDMGELVDHGEDDIEDPMDLEQMEMGEMDMDYDQMGDREYSQEQMEDDGARFRPLRVKHQGDGR